jgi:hypothetical protein
MSRVKIVTNKFEKTWKETCFLNYKMYCHFHEFNDRFFIYFTKLVDRVIYAISIDKFGEHEFGRVLK